MKLHMPKLKFKLKRSDLERLLIAGAAALVLLLAAVGAPPAYPTESYTVPESETLPDVSTIAAIEGPSQDVTVYYADAEGYLIPVTRQVAKTAGIAKAALSLMVASDQNDLAAARLGLRTVIPESTTFDLNIEGGKARIDLSSNVLNIADAETESVMVSSIVQTLCEFESVDSVRFLIGGQARSKLTHGTDVSGEMTGDLLNLESVSAGTSLTDSDLVRLYFPSETGRVLVPVTRAVFGGADVNTAVLEWVKGPRKDSGLQPPAPEGSGLVDVSVANGVATINFSEEFAQVAGASDGGQQALRALMLTCLEYPGVSRVSLLVGGQPYTGAQVDAPTFVNNAEQVAVQFPGVIEID